MARKWSGILAPDKASSSLAAHNVLRHGLDLDAPHRRAVKGHEERSTR